MQEDVRRVDHLVLEEDLSICENLSESFCNGGQKSYELRTLIVIRGSNFD